MISVFLHAFAFFGGAYYLPVYFQACKDSSPVGSGVNVLPYSLSIAPFAIVAGGTATALNKYKPQNVLAWACVAVRVPVADHVAPSFAGLDPPLVLYFPRLVLRTFLRLFRLAPPCSSGCEERASEVFFSRASIIWW